MKNLTHYLLLGTAFVFMLSSCTKPDSKPAVPPPTVKLTLSMNSVPTGQPLPISFVASSTINIKSFKIEDILSGNTAGIIIKDSTVDTTQLAYAMSFSTTTPGSRNIKVTVTDANNQSSSDMQPLVVIGSNITASLDGTAWASKSNSAFLNSGFIHIRGISSNNTLMEIQIPSVATPGSYTVGTGIYEVTYARTPYDAYPMSSGTIVINSNTNGMVSGTFSGTLTEQMGSNVITCTNGTFTAQYQ